MIVTTYIDLPVEVYRYFLCESMKMQNASSEDDVHPEHLIEQILTEYVKREKQREGQ